MVRSALAYSGLDTLANQHRAHRQRHSEKEPQLPNVDNSISAKEPDSALLHLIRAHLSGLAAPQTMSQRSMLQERCIWSPNRHHCDSATGSSHSYEDSTQRTVSWCLRIDEWFSESYALESSYRGTQRESITTMTVAY
jgi:hypothetical protein